MPQRYTSLCATEGSTWVSCCAGRACPRMFAFRDPDGNGLEVTQDVGHGGLESEE
jgi:hypothetical protein